MQPEFRRNEIGICTPRYAPHAFISYWHYKGFLFLSKKSGHKPKAARLTCVEMTGITPRFLFFLKTGSV
ncbi:MAG TPA: hypothetical protein PLY78_12155, partial [Methanospirillum sp.]|nr:hypothetical protein [Methanospirillum sp.]